MPPDAALPTNSALPPTPAASVTVGADAPLNHLEPCGTLPAILVAAKDAVAFTAGLDAAALAAMLETDHRTSRAVQSALAEIAALAAALPAELRTRHPGVDWRGWIGLPALLAPAVLRHEAARLRAGLDEDLPVLRAAVEVELARMTEQA